MKPTSIPELQAIVRDSSRLQPRGRGSKTALTTPQAGVVALDLTGFSGMQVGDTVSVRGLLTKNGFSGPGPIGDGSPTLVAGKVRLVAP